MTSLNISLPDSMKAFIEKQATAGGFGTVSEYARHLIRKAQRDARLEQLLLEGLHSGPPIEVTDEWWEQRRRELIERHGKTPRSKSA